MKQKIKAKGHYTYKYISKVEGQGRQYPHTADLDLGPGSGLRKSLWYQPSPTTVCKQNVHPQPVAIPV